jgi:hypothetical protein
MTKALSIHYDLIENDKTNNSSIAACAFVAAETFTPSHYLATESLPSNNGERDTPAFS